MFQYMQTCRHPPLTYIIYIYTLHKYILTQTHTHINIHAVTSVRVMILYYRLDIHTSVYRDIIYEKDQLNAAV